MEGFKPTEACQALKDGGNFCSCWHLESMPSFSRIDALQSLCPAGCIEHIMLCTPGLVQVKQLLMVM